MDILTIISDEEAVQGPLQTTVFEDRLRSGGRLVGLLEARYGESCWVVPVSGPRGLEESVCLKEGQDDLSVMLAGQLDGDRRLKGGSAPLVTRVEAFLAGRNTCHLPKLHNKPLLVAAPLSIEDLKGSNSELVVLECWCSQGVGAV